MSKPKVSVRYIDSLLQFEWLPVAGASLYKIQIFDSDMVMLEDVSYRAATAYRKYYHSVFDEQTFTAYVTAESDDFVRSTTAVTFKSRSDCPGKCATYRLSNLGLVVNVLQYSQSHPLLYFRMVFQLYCAVDYRRRCSLFCK